MQINLPSDADAFVLQKAAAAGFGDDVTAYVAHLIVSDQSAAEKLAESDEVAAVQEGIDAYKAGDHRLYEEFAAEFMAERGIQPER